MLHTVVHVTESVEWNMHIMLICLANRATLYVLNIQMHLHALSLKVPNENECIVFAAAFAVVTD